MTDFSRTNVDPPIVLRYVLEAEWPHRAVPIRARLHTRATPTAKLITDRELLTLLRRLNQHSGVRKLSIV
ncbi:MAG: hypothetical protein V4723_00230 [Pseudomonadota bacterium]